MDSTTPRLKITMLACALLALGFSAAWATPADGDTEKRIEIKHKVHCKGDDCADAEGERTVIFIDDEGNEKVIDGDHVWVGADDAHAMKMIMRGPGQKGGFLGVGLTELTPELRTHFGVPEGSGVMVSKVVDDSAAAKAGIQVGDIITLVDSEEIESGGALSHAIGAHEGGDSVTLEVWREGRMQQLTATLGEHEGRRMALMPHMKMRHGAAGDKKMKRIEIRCKDGDENCGAAVGDFDCGGADECEVWVECSDDGCTCTVNGEDADCSEIPGVPGQ